MVSSHAKERQGVMPRLDPGAGKLNSFHANVAPYIQLHWDDTKADRTAHTAGHPVVFNEFPVPLQRAMLESMTIRMVSKRMPRRQL